MRDGPGNDPSLVQFRDGDKTEVFRAARSDVLLVLKRASSTPYGMYVEFQGTEAELIAASVASADMFQDIGKSGQRTASTAFGDRYELRKRAKGRFDLTLYLSEESRCGDPSEKRTQGTVWWRAHGAEVEAQVADALERMRQPRRAKP